MREKELIVYRDFEDGELLYDMAFLMSHYDDEYYNTEDMAALFYECIHDLIDLAGNYGFHGNLWHCYLANLLVNNETATAAAVRSAERLPAPSTMRRCMISAFSRNSMILILLP